MHGAPSPGSPPGSSRLATAPGGGASNGGNGSSGGSGGAGTAGVHSDGTRVLRTVYLPNEQVDSLLLTVEALRTQLQQSEQLGRERVAARHGWIYVRRGVIARQFVIVARFAGFYLRTFGFRTWDMTGPRPAGA